jgi:hypothetical protein
MPREPIPFTVADLSVFARALSRALTERESAEPPSHVEMLNLLARASGHRNFQALRAARRTPATPLAAEDRASLPLSPHARKALRLFDSRDRMTQWPSRFAVQKLAMWILWTKFELRRVYTEKEVNAVLKDANLFEDHVTLRRELINHHLLTRTSDCAEYRKLAARPDDEARALLHAWRERERGAGDPHLPA